jgi:hypothetical protein
MRPSGLIFLIFNLFINKKTMAKYILTEEHFFSDLFKEISKLKGADQIELLGAATFGKDWYESITKVRDERRTAAAAPPELRKKIADADTADASSRAGGCTSKAACNGTQTTICLL